MNTATKLAASVAVIFAIAGAAQAAPIGLPPGPLFIQFNNLEQFSATNQILQPGAAVNPVTGALTPAVTEGNWGVFNVSSLQRGTPTIPNIDIGGGPTFFSDDGPGGAAGQITGIFWGVSLLSGTTAAGGFIDLWWNDPGSDTVTSAMITGTDPLFTPASRTAANLAGGFTTGTFLARLEFASGILPGSPAVDLVSSTTPSNIGSGLADAYANVVDVNGDMLIDSADGVWAGLFDTDYFFVNPTGLPGGLETRDLRFSTFFNGMCTISPVTGLLVCTPNWGLNLAADGSPIVGLRSNDPARTFVPEPGSLALLGAALLGAAAGMRRRREQKQ